MFTALLIAILIVTGAATVVGAGLLLTAARRREFAKTKEPKLLDDSQGAAERTIHQVRVGDIVQTKGVDYLVEGVIHFDESGHRWHAARLTDGANERWLIVGGLEQGEHSLRRLLDCDQEIEIAGLPPETLITHGVRYQLDKRGTATCQSSGEIGQIPGYHNYHKSPLKSHSRCKWWQYGGAGGDALIIEEWSGKYRVLRGEAVSETNLEFLPGS